jgi:hypothetical protein
MICCYKFHYKSVQLLDSQHDVNRRVDGRGDVGKVLCRSWSNWARSVTLVHCRATRVGGFQLRSPGQSQHRFLPSKCLMRMFS